MRTETIIVTPNWAAEMLEKNSRNRNLSRQKIKAYAEDMKKDRWHETHQGVAVYETGELADGQHRLAAVVESGKPVKMLVTYDLPVTAGADIDRHRPRSDADAIRIGGLSDWMGREEIAIVKAIATTQGHAPGALPASAIAEVGELMKPAIQFTTSQFHGKRRNITTAPVMAAFALAAYYEDETRLMQFADVLIHGIADGPDDVAAIRLRENLLKRSGGTYGQAERYETMAQTMRAIQAFCKREHLQRLRTPKELIYNIG